MNWYSGSSKPTRKMTVQVDVQFVSTGAYTPSVNDISAWVNSALVVAQHTVGGEVLVRVVDAGEMQVLNSEFRQQDKPTNVLSFPAGEIAGMPGDAVLPLGDVVVCASIVNDEAQQQGKAPADHWAHMIVHGTLHLMGYDHEETMAAAEMEGLEIQALYDYGIANPYGESPRET